MYSYTSIRAVLIWFDKTRLTGYRTADLFQYAHSLRAEISRLGPTFQNAFSFGVGGSAPGDSAPLPPTRVFAPVSHERQRSRRPQFRLLFRSAVFTVIQ